MGVVSPRGDGLKFAQITAILRYYFRLRPAIAGVRLSAIRTRFGEVRQMKSLVACALAAMASAVAAPASAGIVVYDNYTDTVDTLYDEPVWGYLVGWYVSYPGIGKPYGSGIAMPFTVATGQDLPLESIAMAMYKEADGTPANLTIRLVKDGGNSLPSIDPDDVLEVLAVDPFIPEDTASFLNLTSVVQPILEDGATYWVTAEVTRFDTASDDQDVVYYWIENKQGAEYFYTLNAFNYSLNGGLGDWQGYYNQPIPYGAPTLRVVVAPEPASLLLTGAGLALPLLRRRVG